MKEHLCDSCKNSEVYPDCPIEGIEFDKTAQKIIACKSRIIKRVYEKFVDESYYDMICVRRKGVRDFNSMESWHFISDTDANLFLELLNKAK